MQSINKTTRMEDMRINVKTKLSALWVALMLLYIYADILSLFRPGQLERMTQGLMGPFPVSQASLLMASILMIIPAVMVVLSLTLWPRWARWINIGAGVLYTAVNLSNLIGETWVYYMLFGVAEIVLTSLIVWFAWMWPQQEGSSK